MRYNILKKAFVIYTITTFTLVSCDSNSMLKLKKINDQTSAKKDIIQSDDSTNLNNKASEMTIYSNNDNTKENDEGNLAPGENQEKAKENLAPGENQEKAKENLAPGENQEKAKLIAEIIKKTKDNAEILKEYKNKTEDDGQYGMQMHVFKLLKISSNNKPMNNILNKSIRAKLYASLDWNQDTIEKFGQILNAIAVNDTEQLAKSILVSGIEYSQSYFEQTVNAINNKKDNLNKLEIEQLKDIKNNLFKVEELKNKWKDTVNLIINDYEANTSDIKSDNQKLRQYISSTYNTIFSTELRQIEQVYKNITNVISIKQ